MDSEVWMVSFVGIEGGNTHGCRGSIVVGELHEQKKFRPVILLIIAINADVLFESLVSSLSLSVTFWIIARCEVESHV